MKILGLDFETNGDDAKSCLVTEVGAILCEVRDFGPNLRGYGQLERLSQLCWQEGYPAQTAKIIEITGIDDAMLQMDGRPVKEVFAQKLFPMIEKAELILAHNKKFDQTVFESVCERTGMNPPKRRWVCTMNEVPYPEKYRCRQLAHIAFDHRLDFDPDGLHRAVNDVELMLRVALNEYGIHAILKYADEPWVYHKAVIPPPWEDGGKGKDAASKLGYSWQRNPRWENEAPTFEKTWVKRTKASQYDKEVSTAPFKVVRLN